MRDAIVRVQIIFTGEDGVPRTVLDKVKLDGFSDGELVLTQRRELQPQYASSGDLPFGFVQRSSLETTLVLKDFANYGALL